MESQSNTGLTVGAKLERNWGRIGNWTAWNEILLQQNIAEELSQALTCITEQLAIQQLQDILTYTELQDCTCFWEQLVLGMELHVERLKEGVFMIHIFMWIIP